MPNAASMLVGSRLMARDEVSTADARRDPQPGTPSASPEARDTRDATAETMLATISPQPDAVSSTSAVHASRLSSVRHDRFALTGEIGRGGMGRVVAAQDRLLDRAVAVKLLLAGDVESKQRFEREALMTARLQHPGIVPIYDAGTLPSGETFYAMKLV